jgi:hypothetical protein
MKLTSDSSDSDGGNIAGKYSDKVMFIIYMTSNEDYKKWAVKPTNEHPLFDFYNLRWCFDDYYLNGNDGWQHVFNKEISTLKDITNVVTKEDFEDIQTLSCSNYRKYGNYLENNDIEKRSLSENIDISVLKKNIKKEIFDSISWQFHCVTGTSFHFVSHIMYYFSPTQWEYFEKIMNQISLEFDLEEAGDAIVDGKIVEWIDPYTLKSLQRLDKRGLVDLNNDLKAIEKEYKEVFLSLDSLEDELGLDFLD